ncbi:SAP30-binding protein [Entomophthora muscae]|uniref:SAP30-binding protein n=1 Tax=Entomophthora muscae TaxID=34485 RepID=A0ACC2TNX6_9FUNG|nr:SAP30-binding protein [Entomophthora muscae]
MPEAWPGCPSWELPPEPETEINPELQAKVAGLQAILERGIQFNQRLRANQSFRNPHIYDKLVEFLDLDEFGTNFPKSWYDPSAFPSAIRGSRLTEAQKAAAKAKAAAQATNPRSNITFVSAQAPSEIASSAIKRVMSSIENSAPLTKYPESRRRKTKWDLPPSAS